MTILEFRVSLVERRKGRQWGWREHFKQIQWKWQEAALQRAQAVGSSIAAIYNTFPRASTLTPLHLHFLPAILPGWNWGRPKCWLEITQSSQPWSWAVLQCIKLGLTSPFSPSALHQKFTLLRHILKKTRGLEATQRNGINYNPSYHYHCYCDNHLVKID